MKKAFAWLEGKGISYRLHDYRKEGVPPSKVKSWVKELGWEQLVNTRGPTFRQLPPARQQGLDAAKAAALMTEVPTVIRRPVIEGGKRLVVGFDPAKYEELLMQ